MSFGFEILILNNAHDFHIMIYMSIFNQVFVLGYTHNYISLNSLLFSSFIFLICKHNELFIVT